METSEFLDKIKEHINVLKGLLTNSYNYYWDAEFLHRHMHSEDAPVEFKFLGRVGISHYIITVIELAKIVVYSDNHHFNIYKLFNLIEENNNSTNDKRIDFELKKNKDELIKSYASTIKNIKKLRNKAFAHTDKEILSSSYTFTLRFDQIKALLDFLVGLINDLIQKIDSISTLQIETDDGTEQVYKLVEKTYDSIPE